MRKSVPLLLALSLLLTGCAATAPAPKVTPVDLKYCALAKNFDDDGLGRAAYIALQQLKVQTGASVQATESSLQKLTSSGCALIITGGDDLVNEALSNASVFPDIKFVAVADNFTMPHDFIDGSLPTNFSLLNFNMAQGAYLAGYLAAAETTEVNQVFLVDTLKNAYSKKLISNFKYGLERFNTAKGKNISVKLVSKLDGLEVVFAIANDSTSLPPLEVTTGKPAIPRIIGFSRDWAKDSVNESLKSSILTSVIRIDAVSKIVSAALDAKQQVTLFDLTNNGIGLAPTGDLAFPDGFDAEVKKISEELLAGKIRVG